MKLFEKIKKRRAKRYLIKSLKIISKLSWEELDDILPRPNYKDFFAFNVEDWSNLKLTYPFNPTEKVGDVVTITDAEIKRMRGRGGMSNSDKQLKAYKKLCINLYRQNSKLQKENAELKGIKTTDWLTRGMSTEELVEQTIEAMMESE